MSIIFSRSISVVVVVLYKIQHESNVTNDKAIRIFVI